MLKETNRELVKLLKCPDRGINSIKIETAVRSVLKEISLVFNIMNIINVVGLEKINVFLYVLDFKRL